MVSDDLLTFGAVAAAAVAVASVVFGGRGSDGGLAVLEVPSGDGLSASPGGGNVGGATGSGSSDGSRPTGLPSGGDDPLSEAARDYYDDDSTPSAPFGAVGEAANRADMIDDDNVVGL